jgi:Fe2+ transport system protein FeoA
MFTHSRGPHHPDQTLANILPGENAIIVDFLPGISSEQRAHLLAYGVIPGSIIRVIQQTPVTILEVDQLELALEKKIANSIKVSG